MFATGLLISRLWTRNRTTDIAVVALGLAAACSTWLEYFFIPQWAGTLLTSIIISACWLFNAGIIYFCDLRNSDSY